MLLSLLHFETNDTVLPNLIGWKTEYQIAQLRTGFQQKKILTQNMSSRCTSSPAGKIRIFLIFTTSVQACLYENDHLIVWSVNVQFVPKIQQTKMLVMCQRFGDWFLFGLVWPYSSNQKNIMKVGSKSLLLTCSSNKLLTYLYYIFLIRRES